jgi:hypothetical protein
MNTVSDKKSVAREQIAADTAAFLASGKKIEQVASKSKKKSKKK